MRRKQTTDPSVWISANDVSNLETFDLSGPFRQVGRQVTKRRESSEIAGNAEDRPSEIERAGTAQAVMQA
jgi:hypothetical protein